MWPFCLNKQKRHATGFLGAQASLPAFFASAAPDSRQGCPRSQGARLLATILKIDLKAFRHAVKSAAVDAKHLGRACAASADRL